MLSTIVLVILILLLVGALPTLPYSANWAYAPGAVLGMVLVITLILALLGRVYVEAVRFSIFWREGSRERGAPHPSRFHAAS
jgi:membrane protease YdiL (CAAX protease family)